MRHPPTSAQAYVEKNEPSRYTEYQLQRILGGDLGGLDASERERLQQVLPSERPAFFKRLYSDHLNECREALRRDFEAVDPLNFLAMFATGGYMKIPTAEGKGEINQVHIELAQFLVLKYGSHLNSTEPSLPIYSRIAQSIRNVLLYGGLLRSPALDSTLSAEDSQRQRIAYGVAQNFAGLRNWAYPSELDDLLTRLTEPLEGAIQQRLGCTVADIIRFWRKLSNLTYERLLFMDQLRKAAQTAEDFETLPLKEKAEQLGIPALVTLLDDRLTPSDLQNGLNRMCAVTFTFSASALIGCVGGSEGMNCFQNYIKGCTLQLGDLRDSELTDAIYTNPVWDRPLIQTTEDTFFVCAPSLFHSFAFRHLESLFERLGLATKYERRRSRFLEEEIQKKLRAALPSAELFGGNHFWADAKRRENDLMVKVGNWLIAVEAKAHKINGPAQRGAQDSLNNAIDRLMKKPAEQSAAFASYLCNNQTRCELERRNGEKRLVDISECVRIIRLTVTLESLGSLAAQVGAIQESGIVPADYPFPVTMNVADLGVVLAVLTDEEERLDYLFRRVGLWKSAPVDGEERDLLVFYLASQLRAEWSRAADGAFLGIAGWRRKLDDYYFASVEGRTPIRYVREYTDLWKGILALFRVPPRHCWPEASAILLTFGHDEQRKIEKQIYQSLKSKTRGIARMLTILGWSEKIAICFKAFRPGNIEWGVKNMEREALRIIQDGEADQVLWIVFSGSPILKPIHFGMKTNHANPRWV